MDFDLIEAELIEEQNCPICKTAKYKDVIDELLLYGVSYDGIFKYMLEKQGARIAVTDIKQHKENHFKLREQKAFKAVEKQQEMMASFEEFKVGQQRSINLINALNFTLDRCLTRLEPLMVDNKGLVNDKTILGYMEQVRKTSESLAKLKGELTEGGSFSVHIIKNETDKLREIVVSVLDELAPELKEQFYLKLAEKLEESANEEE